jgi:hypothetical protein
MGSEQREAGLLVIEARYVFPGLLVVAIGAGGAEASGVSIQVAAPAVDREPRELAAQVAGGTGLGFVLAS